LSSSELTTPWERVGYVESRVRQKGWSMAICAELATELGVDPRTVSRYWEKAQRWTRRTLKPQDVETWRMHQLQLLDQSAREAFEEKRYGEVAQLLKVAASITGTNAAVKVEHSGSVAVSHHAALDRVNALSVDELRELTSPQMGALEARFVEVEQKKSAETLVSADLAPHTSPEPAQAPPDARQAAVERAMSRLRRA